MYARQVLEKFEPTSQSAFGLTYNSLSSVGQTGKHQVMNALGVDILNLGMFGVWRVVQDFGTGKYHEVHQGSGAPGMFEKSNLSPLVITSRPYDIAAKDASCDVLSSDGGPRT